MILERFARDFGHALRSVHAKAHGALMADASLSPKLAQGLFATPGGHKVTVHGRRGRRVRLLRRLLHVP